MESLNLKNVIGNAETVTKLTREMFGAMANLEFPIGHRAPSNWCPPTGYVLERVTVKDVPMERLLPERGGNGKVILMLHGGAYVAALTDLYRNLAVTYSQLTEGCEVVNVDYRVAPTHVYPAALEDVVTAYEALLNWGYKNEDIIITGDSAGGGLALALTLYLKDHNLPLPKGVILLSAWTELNTIAPSHRINYEKDFTLGKRGCFIAPEIDTPSYLGDTDYRTPYASPLHGDYTNLPPLLIQVGTLERLYDDSTRVAEKAEKAGVDVTLSSYYGMFHFFQGILPEIPESQMAWEEIKQFIKKCFNL